MPQMYTEKSDQYIVTGPNYDFQPDTRQAGQILIDKMKEYGDKITHINASSGRSETFSSFRLRCLRAARVMRECLTSVGGSFCDDDVTQPECRQDGGRQPRSVCVCAGNSADVYVTAVAALLCGAPFNVLDPGLSKDDMSHMFCMLRPGLVFCHPGDVERVELVLRQDGRQQLNATQVVVYDCATHTKWETFREFQRETGNEEDFKAFEFSDLRKATALVVCSSGTTGLPKGVMISHHSLFMGIMNFPFGRPEDYCTFAFSTLYWLSGCLHFYEGLYMGKKRIYTKECYTEELCAQILEKYKVETVFLPPSNINRLIKWPELAKYDLSNLKTVQNGGGRVDFKNVYKFLRDKLPHVSAIVAYGMTETSVISRKFLEEPALESVGALRPGVTVKIVDPSTNETLPFGEIGEICVKNPDNLMLGYRDNPEAYAKTVDEQGWLHSGDAGYLDDKGYLYITDRYKEMLKYHNWPICPAEVEAVIRNHRSVVECCVVGVPYEDHGDLLVAYVMTTPGADIKEDEIKDLVANRLADAKRLRGGVKFLKELPTLPSGKIDRKAIKRQALEVADELIQKADA